MTFKFNMSTTAPHLSCRTAPSMRVLPDGVHLIRAATNKLESNLRLELRQGEVTAHKDHRRRAEGDGPAEDAAHTPDSPEQPALDYYFWQTVAKKCHPRKPKPHHHHPNRLGHNHRDLPTQSVHAPTTKVHERRLVAIVTQDMTLSRQATRQARFHGPTRSQVRIVPSPLMNIPARRPPTPTLTSG